VGAHINSYGCLWVRQFQRDESLVAAGGAADPASETAAAYGRHQADWRVHMVWYANNDRIDLAMHRIEHLTKVSERLTFG
jgi:hypothetical protein